MALSTTSDLARFIVATVQILRRRKLPQEHVEELLRVLYAVSLSADEGVTPVCDVVWLDPDNPDPDAPPYVRCDRWIFTRLETPILLTSRELAKLSRASDPRSSWLVVYPKRRSRKIYIWGLIDQAGSNFVGLRTYTSTTGYDPPGLFQVSVTGLGRLEAYAGMDRIASLHNQDLRRVQLDAFWSRAVLGALTPGLDRLAQKIHSAHTDVPNDEVLQLSTSAVVESLSRILRHIQSFRHGGALLITPNKRFMRTKYKVIYTRLREAITHSVINTLTADLQFERFRTDRDSMTAEALIGHHVMRFDVEDAQSELDGAEWFTSVLTRVDGAVVLSPQLVIFGYGAEITSTSAPGQVWLARDKHGTRKHAKALDYQHFGTRHRSAMRYCTAVPGAVAFVVSQDGDVRIIANVTGRTTVWENVKMSRDEFVTPELLSVPLPS